MSSGSANGVRGWDLWLCCAAYMVHEPAKIKLDQVCLHMMLCFLIALPAKRDGHYKERILKLLS